GLAGLLGGRPDPVVALLVLRVGAVAHVEPGHVHAGLDQRPELVEAVDRRAQSADDLRLSRHHGPIQQKSCHNGQVGRGRTRRGGRPVAGQSPLTRVYACRAISSSSSVGTTATVTRLPSVDTTRAWSPRAALRTGSSSMPSASRPATAASRTADEFSPTPAVNT